MSKKLLSLLVAYLIVAVMTQKGLAASPVESVGPAALTVVGGTM